MWPFRVSIGPVGGGGKGGRVENNIGGEFEEMSGQESRTQQPLTQDWDGRKGDQVAKVVEG